MEKLLKPETEILVIEDEHNIRKIIKLLLSPFFDVSEAGSGQQAMEILRKKDINIVFLDVVMFKTNGVDVLQQIKKLNPDIEVCMLTATVNPSLEEQARKLGAVAWLEKPCHAYELIAVAKGMAKIVNEKQKINLALKTISTIKEQLTKVVALPSHMY